MHKLYTLLISGLLFCLASHAQNPAPAPAQSRPVVIENTTLHLGTGQVMQHAYLAFEQGKITDISQDPIRIEGAEVIDGRNKHVYPGFILPNTTLGLREIDAVRATLDFAETGQYNPNVRALVAYNTDSEIIPTVRLNGVLIAQTTPRGGVISGTSSIMMLDGWTWEEAVLKADDGIHLNWVPMFRRRGWQSPIEPNKERSKQLQYIEDFFAEAAAYAKQSQAGEVNLKFEAMRGLFDGSKTLYVHADRAREMVEAVQFAKKMGIRRVVLVGGTEAWLIAGFLKEHQVPVLLNRVHDLPPYEDSDVDHFYKQAALLFRAGVLVGLQYAGDMEAMGSRNLGFTAGTAAAYGLAPEEALQLITLNNARILGIDKQTGSLEVGKDATLFISRGDALDMRSNQIERAFIQGRDITLESKQTRLYHIYSKKYGLRE
ncbi:MAG: amidohydrolase [Thermonema sp.]|uniref:amidohydrolase family protein n=1 Tax=Thermonema sp. TaxID=2231181 RepID=UPI0021DE987E|nr:amidohydrolase family protein [Thermonema sp.]GIV40648.1 MAG: amidohydrolase [Thermonema sp.]